MFEHRRCDRNDDDRTSWRRKKVGDGSGTCGGWLQSLTEYEYLGLGALS